MSSFSWKRPAVYAGGVGALADEPSEVSAPLVVQTVGGGEIKQKVECLVAAGSRAVPCCRSCLEDVLNAILARINSKYNSNKVSAGGLGLRMGGPAPPVPAAPEQSGSATKEVVPLNALSTLPPQPPQPTKAEQCETTH